MQDAHKDELKHLCLSLIIVNPYQPRREFGIEELKELAQSIQTVGLLHPPLVRPLPASAQYELISGERRFRAAQLASLSTIPVYVRRTSAEISAQATLIENIQRVNLNPLEIAQALKRLMLEFGLNQEELAQRIGKKRSTVANYLRLLTLPLFIQDNLRQEKISMGHAKAILSLEQEDQHLLCEQIIEHHLTVRQAEQAAAQRGENKQKEKKLSPSQPNPHLEELSRHLRERLGTKVLIRPRAEKEGELCIDYYSWQDLEHIYKLLMT